MKYFDNKFSVSSSSLQECTAPLTTSSLQSGQFWASLIIIATGVYSTTHDQQPAEWSVLSYACWLLESMRAFQTTSVIREQPSGLVQSSSGHSVKMFIVIHSCDVPKQMKTMPCVYSRSEESCWDNRCAV